MNQMLNLKDRLALLDKDIRVAVVGIGSMGKGLVYQLHNTPGMKPVAIADLDLKRALACAEWLDLPYDVVDTVSNLNFSIQSGRLAVTDNAELIASSNLVHVMIESTNSVLPAALHVIKALTSHQHVVMMNFEADLMYGPLLMQIAQEQGVVYTCADGDKPTAIKKLIDEVSLYGFDLVMAGNIKNFQDRYTTPEKIAFEADMRNLDHTMCSYFTDGTKECVEMAVLANAINGRTAVPGMYGHRTSSINDVFQHYNFDELWDGKTPLVDYMLGAEPRGGLFAIGYTADKFQQSTLGWFPSNMGPGPYYLFYRPYYLGHIEALPCVAEAYLEGTARLQAAYGMKTNVFAYAKQPLKKGQRLDGRGGSKTYGLIENLDPANKDQGLPILISENLRIKRDIARDERIALTDVEYDPTDMAFDMYFEAAGIKLGATTPEKSQPVTESYHFV